MRCRLYRCKNAKKIKQLYSVQECSCQSVSLAIKFIYRITIFLCFLHPAIGLRVQVEVLIREIVRKAAFRSLRRSGGFTKTLVQARDGRRVNFAEIEVEGDVVDVVSSRLADDLNDSS